MAPSAEPTSFHPNVVPKTQIIHAGGQWVGLTVMVRRKERTLANVRMVTFPVRVGAWTVVNSTPPAVAPPTDGGDPINLHFLFDVDLKRSHYRVRMDACARRQWRSVQSKREIGAQVQLVAGIQEAPVFRWRLRRSKYIERKQGMKLM